MAPVPQPLNFFMTCGIFSSVTSHFFPFYFFPFFLPISWTGQAGHRRGWGGSSPISTMHWARWAAGHGRGRHRRGKPSCLLQRRHGFAWMGFQRRGDAERLCGAKGQSSAIEGRLDGAEGRPGGGDVEEGSRTSKQAAGCGAAAAWRRGSSGACEAAEVEGAACRLTWRWRARGVFLVASLL